MASFAFHDSVYVLTSCLGISRLLCKLKRLTRYSALLEMNVGGSKLPFSEAPSFLTSRILPFSRHVRSRSYLPELTTPVNTYCACAVVSYIYYTEEETER